MMIRNPKAVGGAVALLLVFSTTPIKATTIVVLTTTDRIVLAADSRQQLVQIRNGQVVSVSRKDEGCKIQIGKTAAAASWDYTTEQMDGGGGYDALKTARQFLQGPETIPEKLDLFFHEFMKGSSIKVAPNEQKPEQPVGVVLVGWDNGAAARAWTVLSRPPHTPSWPYLSQPLGGSSLPSLLSPSPAFPSLTSPSLLSPSVIAPSPLLGFTTTLDFRLSDLRVCASDRCPAVRVFGVAKGVDQEEIERQLKTRVKEAEMISLARAAVEAAGKAAPELVGGPVDVVVIDKKGVRWHTVKNECKAN